MFANALSEVGAGGDIDLSDNGIGDKGATSIAQSLARGG